MKLERAMKLHAQLTQPQMYDLCRDYLDEQDILFSIKNKMIPELAFQAICRDVIPEYAVKTKLQQQALTIIA